MKNIHEEEIGSEEWCLRQLRMAGDRGLGEMELCALAAHEFEIAILQGVIDNILLGRLLVKQKPNTTGQSSDDWLFQLSKTGISEAKRIILESSVSKEQP